MFLKNSEGRMPPGEKESDFCNNVGIIDLEQKSLQPKCIVSVNW